MTRDPIYYDETVIEVKHAADPCPYCGEKVAKVRIERPVGGHLFAFTRITLLPCEHPVDRAEFNEGIDLKLDQRYGWTWYPSVHQRTQDTAT